MELTLEEIEEHSLTHDVPISPMKSYKDILFHPGPGHIELNIVRCLLKFLWHLLVSSIAKCLRSPRAQELIRNGVDHHRSRQILSVLLESLACELLVPMCSLRGDQVLGQHRKII